jgi:hypothetical protein
MTEESLQDWERLLAAERHLQALVPGAVLVGGTAAALHAGHRVSLDGDHVLDDLRGRFDLAEVIERLGSGRPVDAAEIDLASYRGLVPPWNDWEHVTARGRAWAETLADLLLGAEEDAG